MSPRHEHDPERDERLPEDAATALAASLAPVAVEPERAARLRARIVERARAEAAQHAGAAARAADPARAGEALPSRESFLIARADEGPWLDLLPGVRVRLLHADRERNVQSYLLRLAPGTVLPAHPHHHDEECVVLEGDLRVGEHTVRAGDWHLVRAGVDHAPIRTERGALLFLRGGIY